MKIDETFRSLIPRLSSDEFALLEQNILRDGIRDPLVVWRDTLVDGHNRYEIALKHNLPYRTVQKDFADETDAQLWIVQTQLGRRNLSDYCKSELALRFEPLIRAKAKARQEAKQFGVRDTVVPTLAPPCKTETLVDEQAHSEEDTRGSGKVRDALGKIAGVSHGTMDKVKKIVETADDTVKEKLRSGDLSINEAYKRVRRDEKRQEVQKRIEEHASVPTGAVDIRTTEKKYSVIYADPPWRYWEGGDKNQSLHYPTMSLEEICALPVSRIADENCILFLWVTSPMLFDARAVIESWGFLYSTIGFTWVKRNKNADTPFVGCGAWTRANAELCLIATKGHIERLNADVSQVIEAPVMEHSRKPCEARARIERLVGKLPRIELFCRHPAEGWDYMGNEAEGGDCP